MELIDSLAEEFNHDTVLFVGSGASISAGLPSWTQLVNWLRDYTLEQGGDVDAADNFLQKDDLLNATSSLILEVERLEKSLFDFFVGYDECELFTHCEPQELHQLISKLPTKSIITPNYDLLLEKTFNNSLQVVHKGDLNLINRIQRRKLKDYLYKYHGCITNPKTIVLGYKDYMHEVHEWSNELDCLRHLMQSRTFVFIGAGLEDPDFKFVRDSIITKQDTESLELWAFMQNCLANQNYYKKQFGINLINYEGENGDHTDLHNKLRDLLNKISSHEKEKLTAVKLASQDTKEATVQKDLLRLALDKANEEVIPLDKQILGFAAIFDTATKGECIEYLTEYKGYELKTILNRVEHLVDRKLLKETINHFLPIKEEFSFQAAEIIEEDILEYLAVRQNG